MAGAGNAAGIMPETVSGTSRPRVSNGREATLCRSTLPVRFMRKPQRH
jgi:hypothetical protein